MLAIVMTMIIVLGLTAAIFGLAAVGAQGGWKARMPRLSAWLARLAERLNGDSNGRMVDPPGR